MGLLPLFDRDTELLLDSVAVPLWDDVERAEWNDSEVWCQVVDVAPLKPFKVLVVLVLEVHHAKEHRPNMPRAHRVKVALQQNA